MDHRLKCRSKSITLSEETLDVNSYDLWIRQWFLSYDIESSSDKTSLVVQW